MKNIKLSRISIKYFFIALAILLFSGYNIVFAVEIFSPIKQTLLSQILESVENAFVWIGLPMAIIFIIYGAFNLLNSKGNDESIIKAKKIISWSLIGLVIMIAGIGFTEVIKDVTGVEIVSIKEYEKSMDAYLRNYKTSTTEKILKAEEALKQCGCLEGR